MLAPWKKSYEKPRQHIKKQTHHFADKVCIVKAMVFPVVMYGCESWTIKSTERWRIDAFELWCWGRLLRVPWTARRSNQSILKEINPEYSLEGPMLKLKLQYSGHLMQRADSLEKTLMLGKIEGIRRRHNRGWDVWMASLILWTWVWTNCRRWWRETWRAAVHRAAKSQTPLGDWTTVVKHPSETKLILIFLLPWLQAWDSETKVLFNNKH